MMNLIKEGYILTGRDMTKEDKPYLWEHSGI
jgi:hypothetical protein